MLPSGSHRILSPRLLGLPTASADPLSAFVAGSQQGLASPIGTFWSIVLMLEHLGLPAAAARVMGAIEAVTAEPGLRTRDLGGTATTAEVTRAVCARIAAPGAGLTQAPACARCAIELA